MSGIAGVVFAGRGPVADALAAHLIDFVRHRGPDGASSFTGEGVHLVHAHHATTGHRESNLDRPGVALRIVADIRLDNRTELAASLGINDPTELADADLVCAAYRRWGRACCEHFVGDFAFALWDERERALFCARDQMGVKPFFYAASTGQFHFASTLPAIRLGQGELDDGGIAGFLTGVADDAEATAFRHVRRLPPGHWLALRDGRIVVERYWTLEPESEAAGRSAELAFRERFGDAVTARLRGTAAIGALLSGGLDSSSIVSAAAKGHAGRAGFTLSTFSFDYPQTPALDERDYVDAVLETYALQPNFVSLDDLAPLGGLTTLVDGRDDLCFGPGLPKMSKVFVAANHLGTRVLLDGHGGDEVVSQGYGRLAELAQQGQWLALRRELGGTGRTIGQNPNALFLKYFNTYGPGRHLARPARLLKRLGLLAARDTAGEGTNPPSFLNPDFERRSGAADRYRRWLAAFRQAGRSESALHTWNVSGPQVAAGFEALDRVAAQAGIELRFPFFDRRLVSFALSLPASEKLRDGWPRSILRRAMQGILPEKVRWRRDKVDFSSELSLGMARHHAALLNEVAGDRDGVGAYIDLGRLRRSVSGLLENPAALPATELFMIWRSVFLSLWLRSRSGQAQGQV